MPMFTQYEANRLLAATITGTAYTPSTSFLTPTTTQGTATAAGTELGSGSGRQSWALGTPNAGAGSNVGAVNFTNMSAGTVVGVDSYDAATGGNRKHFGAFSTARTVAAGDTLAIAAGALTASLV